MMFPLILAGIGLVVLLLLARLRDQRLSARIVENPAAHLRPVDIEAFRNLIDPDEEEYLRTRLSPVEFRKIQRERMRAAVECVSCAARNAMVLSRLGHAARHSPDPATAAAAGKLIDEALHLRMYAFQAMPRLYLGILFPSRPMAPLRVAEGYEQMTRQVVLLGLQYPTRGASAAL